MKPRRFCSAIRHSFDPAMKANEFCTVTVPFLNNDLCLGHNSIDHRKFQDLSIGIWNPPRNPGLLKYFPMCYFLTESEVTSKLFEKGKGNKELVSLGIFDKMTIRRKNQNSRL